MLIVHLDITRILQIILTQSNDYIYILFIIIIKI